MRNSKVFFTAITGLAAELRLSEKKKLTDRRATVPPIVKTELLRTKSCARFGLNFSIFLLCQKQKKNPESYRSAATTGPNSTKFRTNHPCVNGTSGFTNKGLINSQRGGYDFFLLSSGMIFSTMFIGKIKGVPRLLFYIIPCYVTI